MKCPICTTRRATSTHHVKPGNSGGSDNHKSKVMLCRPCHDKVEEIYDSTGDELSPRVIELIRLEYGLPTRNIDKDIDRSILATSLYKLRRKHKYRFAKGKSTKAITPSGTAIRCSHCGKWHYPEKNGLVICPILKSKATHVEEVEVFHNMLMEKIKRIRVSIE